MEYNINDSETIMLVKEDNIDAKNALLDKYKFIIDIVISKYKRIAYVLKIDQNDLYQDALLGFTDAINHYQEGKDTTLQTYISVCVDRRVQNALKKASTNKHKVLNESLSLEQIFDNSSNPLIDLISDGDKSDPLNKLTSKESYLELINLIESILSPSEYEVYALMINGVNYTDIASILGKSPKQIDNTIQRIRKKVKLNLDSQE